MVIGVLELNFLGTEFLLHNNVEGHVGLPKDLLWVGYQINRIQNKGPRKIQVGMPKIKGKEVGGCCLSLPFSLPLSRCVLVCVFVCVYVCKDRCCHPRSLGVSLCACSRVRESLCMCWRLDTRQISPCHPAACQCYVTWILCLLKPSSRTSVTHSFCMYPCDTAIHTNTQRTH